MAATRRLSSLSPEEWEAAIQMCIDDTGEDEAFVRAHIRFCAYAALAVVGVINGKRPLPKTAPLDSQAPAMKS